MPRSETPEPGSPSPDRAGDEEGASRISDRLMGFLVVEVISVAIALVTPITPSKTGSTWSPAELVTPDPTYLQKVLASFVMVNVIFVVLAAIVWLGVRRGERRRARPRSPNGR